MRITDNQVGEVLEKLVNDVDINPETYDSVCNFIEFFGADQQGSCFNFYLKYVKGAHSHGWKNEINFLVDSFKVVDDFLTKCTDNSRRGPYFLLVDVLEKSNYNLSIFNSLKTFIENYNSLTGFGWISRVISESVEEIPTDSEEELNNKLTNLFNFYDSDLVKRIIDLSKPSDQVNLITESINPLLLEGKNKYPNKIFQILGLCENEDVINLSFFQLGDSIKNEKWWVLDEILNHSDALIEKETYDLAVYDFLHCKLDNYLILTQPQAKRYFEEVIKDQEILREDGGQSAYLEWVIKIDDDQLRSNFSRSEGNLVSNTYQLCLNYLKNSDHFHDPDFSKEISFNHFFTSYLNEAISHGDSLNEKKSSLRSWCDDVVKSLKREDGLDLMNLFRNYSNETG